MNTQVRCPKCNNTSITTKRVKTVDDVSNRDVSIVNLAIAVLWLIIFALLLFLELSGATMPLYYFLLFLILTVAAIREIVIYFMAHKIKAFDYICNSCKNAWTQRADGVVIPEKKM